MKLMLCQTKIIWENKQENLKNAEAYLKEAAKVHADLVCFPEMSFTGFSMHTELTRDEQQETLKRMQILAGQYGVAVAFGYVSPAKNSPLCENHYAVVDREGRALGDYVKNHSFSYAKEDMYFEAGSELVTFPFMGFQVGLAVCYDLRFPEMFWTLGDTCDIILLGANWPEKRSGHWRVLAQARAIENQCYMACVNCFGEMNGAAYSGNSMLIAPDGTVFGEQLTEGFAVYEIENDVEQYRNAFPVRRDGGR